MSLYKICECAECGFLRMTDAPKLSEIQKGYSKALCTCKHRVYKEGCADDNAQQGWMEPPKTNTKADTKSDLKPRKMKPQVQMNPAAPQYWQARVVEYGAKKYARGNFRLPVEGEAPHEKASEYIRAAIGHLLEAAEKIELHIAGMETSPLAIDEESGLPHLAHAMCSVAFAITAGVDSGIFPKDPKKQ